MAVHAVISIPMSTGIHPGSHSLDLSGWSRIDLSRTDLSEMLSLKSMFYDNYIVRIRIV